MSTSTDHRTTTRHRRRNDDARRPTRRDDDVRRPTRRDAEARPRFDAARGRTVAERDATRRDRAALRRLAGEQLAVAGGQLGAGVGNLVFALIAARVLAPGAFAELAAFLALYLLIHVPAGSLSAGSALTPALAVRVRRRALAVGAAAGAVLALLALPLGALLDVRPALLLAAAAAAPTAGLLALDRGRLYALGRHTRIVGSLLAEPAVRLSLGVALALLLGPVGGAVAVVMAGWAALAVARMAPSTGAAADAVRATDHRHRTTRATVAAFLLLAVIQNQDVLLAGALLDGVEAGRFAVLSTLGGAAAFGTTTVPLMLLSNARADRDALRAALGVAALLGLGAVAVVALSPERLAAGVFGDRYATVGAYAVPYVLAMALLGVARVLVAHACAERAAGRATAMLGAAALLHLGLVLALGDDAAGIATATLVATSVLTAGAAAVVAAPADRGLRSLTATAAAVVAAPAVWDLRSPRDRALVLLRRPDVAAVAGLTIAGLVVRALATRGIWLDEATSIHQAQLPLGELLHGLRTTDVHPPLHHVVLWATVRVVGTGELAVRLPSLLAATALIPLLYVVGREIYDRRAGLAAAALATLAPFAVWYAQEARMYALFMLFALIAVWMQVRIMRGDRRAWFGYVPAAAALVYTQYFGVLLVGVGLLAFLIASRGSAAELRRFGIACAALVLLLAPLMPFALDQFAANEAAGKGFQKVPSQAGGSVGDPGAGPGAYAAITNAAWAVLGYHSNTTMTAIAALWPLGLLLALGMLGRGRSWPTLVIAASAALPAVALFMLGQAKPFVFEVRYFVGAVPLALLLIARALTSWTRRPAVTAAACAAAVGVLGLGLADQQLNGSNPRIYDFRGAVGEIEQRARPGDVIVFTPSYLDHVVAYYERGGLHTRPLANGLPEPRDGRRVFVLASFLDKPQFREAAEDAVRRLKHDHELVRRDSRPQIRTWEFR